jgi:hypothetical protein
MTHFGGNVKYLCISMLIAGLLALAGCGGSQPKGGAFAGNWQFTMAAPSDKSFMGGIQSGFLQQNGNALSGTVVYSIGAAPSTVNTATACNSGPAQITGTVNGSNVVLTVNAGGQTFTLAGTLSADGTTMMGTYTSTAGPLTPVGATGMQSCGSAQSGLQWSALSVPPLNGAVSGNFHDNGGQDFPVTGFLTQGPNVGASSATVTGTLTFQGNTCLGSAAHQTVSLNGTISGKYVVLQMFTDKGVNIGYMGQSVGLVAAESANGESANGAVAPVVFENVASGGYVLHNTSTAPSVGGAANGYAFTPACGQTETGNVCLAMGDGTACTQPITISPAAISFPAQLVGTTSTTQTITLTNTDPSGSTLSGLSLRWWPDQNNSGNHPAGEYSDFSGWSNFLELDSCASPPGSTFSLQPNQSCTITIFFSPQQSCPWIPDPSNSSNQADGVGVAPAQCPPFSSFAQTAELNVNSPKSADSNTKFAVPISGVGLSALAPSTPELDFGAEAVGEPGAPQTLSFTNQGMYPVQILPAASGNSVCSTNLVELNRPVQTGAVDGLRVVQSGGVNALSFAFVPGTTGPPTVSYYCDIDATSQKPNFQIPPGTDTCTGALLYPGDTCTVDVTYAAQPATNTSAGLNYYLELNTQECTGNTLQPGCEIDSGRFPVALTANKTSPLRMSPGAGLDFGVQPQGMASAPLTITLTNDANDPNSGTVDFKGNIVTGDYSETDNCGYGLDPGGTCTMSVFFTPTATGYRRGNVTINYTVPSRPNLTGTQTQTVYMRGTGH